MPTRSIVTARLGRFTSISSVAFVTLALVAAAGCALPSEPSPSPSPAPAASPAPTPSPSSDPASAPAPKPNPTGSGATVSTHVDNATGGTIALPNGTTIDVPPGALPPGVDTITVTSEPTSAPSEYAAASPVYAFGPDGTVFLKPLKVSLPFTLPAGMTTSDLTILWSRPTAEGFDMIPSQFVAVAGSATEFVAVGEVMHFSKGFCGMKYTTDPHPGKDAYGK